MTNKRLKEIIKMNGFTQWQIAECIGVTEMTLYRWLRSEKDTSHQGIILNAVNKCIAEREAANANIN